MLLFPLIAGLALVALLYRRSPRIESSSGAARGKTVRASVDGKPVDSYVKE